APSSSSSPATTLRISLRKSGIFYPRNQIHCGHEATPDTPLLLQHFSTLRRQPVVAPSSLTRLFHPPPLDQAPLFKPVQQRIKRGHVKPKLSLRPLFNQLADLIAVPRPVLNQRKNQQARASLLQFPVKDFRCNMYHSNIMACDTSRVKIAEKDSPK